MLEFKELHIGYGASKKSKKNKLFTANDFMFKPGDFVALIGPNGAGKTTLFNSVLGLNKPLSGVINFNKVSLEVIPRQEKVRILSFVPSKFFGVNNLTVYDLIAMGRAPYTNLLNKLTEEDKTIVSTIVNELNLTKLKDRNTLNLSDGERQIAMIGKALAQKSEVIILDEPTAFLDYNNRIKVLRLLKKIAEKDQKIIFISSHNLELCFEFCNRIIAIDVQKKRLVNYSYPFDRDGIIETIFSDAQNG